MAKMNSRNSNDINKIEKAIEINRNSGFIVFGDSHHGDLVFDFIIRIYPKLNENIKEIIKNANYFSENSYQMNEIKRRNYGKSFIGLDDDTKLNLNTYDELKRNHQANDKWSEIILKNRGEGLNIISIGRSHLYSIKAKKESNSLEDVTSFPNYFSNIIGIKVKVYAMNNELNVKFDDYKEYSKIHQLDDVIDNPRIETIFIY